MIPGVRMVILGRQGAGKGTQCVRLSRHFVVPHISTGDIFRAAVKAGTVFGRKADEFMKQGKLVPDEIVIGVVRERLGQPDARRRGFILDGFPRTAPQAEALKQVLCDLELPLEVTVDLYVPEDVVMDRLVSRRTCSTCGAIYSTEKPPHVNWTCDRCGGEVVQRADDTEDAIRTRLDAYTKQTSPLIAWYKAQGLLVTVNGLGPPDEVSGRLIAAIDGAVRP